MNNYIVIFDRESIGINNNFVSDKHGVQKSLNEREGDLPFFLKLGKLLIDIPCISFYNT